LAVGGKSAAPHCIFIYAFFKFTWSALQYNALSIITGASVRDPYIVSAANVAILAGESFNHGIRAYYFSMAAATWTSALALWPAPDGCPCPSIAAARESGNGTSPTCRHESEEVCR
jgi:hypothetical protein